MVGYLNYTKIASSRTLANTLRTTITTALTLCSVYTPPHSGITKAESSHVSVGEIPDNCMIMKYYKL